MMTADEAICILLFGAFMLLVLNVVTQLRIRRDGLQLSGYIASSSAKALPKKCCLQAQRSSTTQTWQTR
jgi:hypothetical protein